MLISFKQKTSVAKVVQVYIFRLKTEMSDRLRQLYFRSTETADRYRKISGCHTKGHACLIGEKAERPSSEKAFQSDYHTYI